MRFKYCFQRKWGIAVEEDRINYDKVIFFYKPNSDSNVWPKQSCPVFTPRANAVQKVCWYCRYADFHLEYEKSLDVGICCFPKLII